VTRKPVKNGYFGAKSPLSGKNFQNSSIKVQQKTPIDVFFPNFTLICPVTKKSEFIVPVTKMRTFFAAILHLLAQAAKILTRDI